MTDELNEENVPSETAPAADESTSYDIPMAEHLRAAITADWAPAPAMPHPARPDGAPYAARRRGKLSQQFAGQLVVVPAGNPKVRANDTEYPFRAASSFTWLTGESAADAVLVMTPNAGGHDSVLYVRDYAPPGEVAYFTSRMHGGVWVGNVPDPAATAEMLELDHPAIGRPRR